MNAEVVSRQCALLTLAISDWHRAPTDLNAGKLIRAIRAYGEAEREFGRQQESEWPSN